MFKNSLSFKLVSTVVKIMFAFENYIHIQQKSNKFLLKLNLAEIKKEKICASNEFCHKKQHLSSFSFMICSLKKFHIFQKKVFKSINASLDVDFVACNRMEMNLPGRCPIQVDRAGCQFDGHWTAWGWVWNI